MWVFESNSYDGRCLQLVITESVNTADNTSTLYWTLSVVGGEVACYTVDTTTVTIDSTNVYYKYRTPWDDRVFPAVRGSVSGSIVVPHDSDGRRTIYIGFSTRVYYFGPEECGGYISLTQIDRTTPAVSISASSITANSFYLSSSASAYCDIWQYSLDNGSSWYSLSNTGYSAGMTVSGLSADTYYTVRIRARKSSNLLYGYSSYLGFRTLGGAIVNSVDAVTADNATVTLRLNVTVNEASYTNTLEVKNGNTSYLTISNLSWSAGTTTRTITLTTSQRTTLLSAMANVKSFNGTFVLTSYNGSTQVGDASSASATVQTTAANSAPTMGDFSFEDSYATTVAVTGNNQVFIQGQSNLKVTPTAATARNGASITNYTATCNGLSVSSASGSAITVGKINKSGSVSVVLTATDSRGYTVSVTKTITVIPYSKPSLSEVSIRRTNNIESEMQLNFSGFLSAITVDNVQKNALLYARYRYKLTSASTYGSYVNILSTVTASGTSFSYSNPEPRKSTLRFFPLASNIKK